MNYIAFQPQTIALFPISPVNLTKCIIHACYGSFQISFLSLPKDVEDRRQSLLFNKTTVAQHWLSHCQIWRRKYLLPLEPELIGFHN